MVGKIIFILKHMLLQHGVSKVLNIPYAKVESKTRRLGGGFGGKESQATIFACISALATYKLKHPVKLRLDRKTDMKMEKLME